VPSFGGGVINIPELPELEFELALPPTELTGAGALVDLNTLPATAKPVTMPQYGLR